MRAEELLPRLERPKQTGPGKWMASCPGPLHAGGDRRPSLRVSDGQLRVLLTCHAGCKYEEIIAALGLKSLDLLFDKQDPLRRAPRGPIADIHYVPGRGGRGLLQSRTHAVSRRSGCLDRAASLVISGGSKAPPVSPFLVTPPFELVNHVMPVAVVAPRRRIAV